ncbi:MAG: sigma-54 dependent transcriptional regulator [Gammaproteobacteria bacterium]|nr:sigma-54 dependent transcriptional regulator [Gammaproteobacteria bacterium]
MASPAVLLVEDDKHLRDALCDTLIDEDVPVIAARSGPEALSILKTESVGLVVSDLQMEPMDGHTLLGKIRQQHPTLPAVLMTAYGTIENAVDSMRLGAADYLVKPFAADALLDVVSRYLPAETNSGPVAADPQTLRLLRIAAQVALSDATVMLGGESGCGKEVFAQYIHAQSGRSNKPFVAINCAAIPENMLEAVLFGYEKGAFTGANTAHAGKFEQANGGTLLLDEISEMDLGLQAKLLRVLQEREVERIGGSKTISLDVRVVATSNRDLRRRVAQQRFREDLYYRLNVFPLAIPPLRERRGDILPLAEMALRKHFRGSGSPPTLSDAAQQELLRYSWPGNVRELENLIQRSLILLHGSEIGAPDLVFEHPNDLPTEPDDESAALSRDLKQHEFSLLVDALRESQGNRGLAAERLGISPRTLRYKLAKLRDSGIELPPDLVISRRNSNSEVSGNE